MLAGAGKTELDHIAERCPDLDLVCFQLYGAIKNLPQLLDESNYKGAYIVSEWGATGHWEVPKTEWGRPIEQNSHVKAMGYQNRYNDYIAADPDQCIGSFVFLWGQKQERTPTWYGIFLESGEKTESADVMQYVWTGNWPVNRAPVMQQLTIEGHLAIDNVILKPGKKYTATASVNDMEKDALSYRWVIMHEVAKENMSDGGDFEPSPETVLELSGDGIGNQIEFETPTKGEYRLFVYVSDGNGGAATANIPFLAKMAQD